MASNTPIYKLYEIFYSIQGEGHFVGKPAIFIRFSGCNLTCSFCDEHHNNKPTIEYTLGKIINEVEQYSPCKFVVLTGGEPTIQPELSFLILELQKLDYFVMVETNGTNRIDTRPNWITVSPHTDSFYYGDELKLLYEGQDLSKFEKLPFKHFYLQPINHKDKVDPLSMEKCLNVVKQNPKWKISVQLHKLLNIK